ncbi:hypothetical protein [Wohlfahrtiimonas populi]|uniref:hypothetical protein n=1 Tax=Wohlfahrtiimonas populi TaxID=1940240 RepID=UPI00098D6C3E|nr:hypothetical protein [Wohlfahrtiimonas populi]
MYKALILLMLSIAITACSSTPSWKKKGANSEDAESALAMCHYQINLAKIDGVIEDEMVKNCMVGQGYRFK